MAGGGYYAVFHDCQRCGRNVWVEDKMAPEGTSPNNIHRSDSTCPNCANRPMSDDEKRKLGIR